MACALAGASLNLAAVVDALGLIRSPTYIADAFTIVLLTLSARSLLSTLIALKRLISLEC